MPSSLEPDRLLLPLVSLLFAAALAGQGIPWERSLEVALKTAADEQKVMLVAVVMPGERGSDGVIEHYRDPELSRLCRACVCYRVDVGTDRPSDDERAVLERYLGAAPRDPVIVPHHVIVHPDGRTVLSSAAWQMTAGQLEWFVADGIQRFDPKFTWALGERARAPEGLRYGAEVEKTEQTPTPPPTAAEVDEAIAELKKSRGGWRGAIEHYTVLLRSDQPAAIKYVETQLRGGRGFMTPIALASIADVSPVEWAPLLCEFVDDRDAGHRESAARGLAKMADEQSAKAVKKQLRAEKEPAVRAWLVRAAVTTSPKDKATIAAVEKVLADDDDATVRMHAAVAAGALEDKAAARRLMQQALADQDPNVRSAGAFAMATSRDQDYAEVLEQALAGERDAETKYWIELAVATLREQRDLREFRRFRTEVLGERFGVDRNRGGAGGGEPGGGGQPGGGGSGRPGGG